MDYHIILDMDRSIVKTSDLGSHLLDFLHVLVMSPSAKERGNFLVKKLMFSSKVHSNQRELTPFDVWRSTKGKTYHVYVCIEVALRGDAHGIGRFNWA